MNLINVIIKGWHQIKLSRDLQVKYSYNLWHEASFIGIDLQTDRAVRIYFSHFLNNTFSSCVFLEHLACMACFWSHSMQQMPLMAARVVPALILMKILSTLWIKSNPLLCLFSFRYRWFVRRIYFRLLSFTVGKTYSLSLSLFSPDYF